MISIEELRKISKLKGIFNLGNTEKDYIQDIVLLSISRNTKDEMIFKGGTCPNSSPPGQTPNFCSSQTACFSS